ncbi:MAG: dienelactone hydrolase family protein [Anaerolineae bacterium]|nr:dienelactone hydrolase family protein [Anaerolineae bacterium]
MKNKKRIFLGLFVLLIGLPSIICNRARLPTALPTQPAIPSKTTQPELQSPASYSPTASATAYVFEKIIQEKVIYDQSQNLSGYLCIPAGAGPFPAIVYNHGGLGTTIGGAPEETCQALAEVGVVGFSPLRRETTQLFGHAEDVVSGLEYVKGLDYVDTNRLGMIGFSRGGLLTYITASQRTDLRLAIIMASAAPDNQDFSQYTNNINLPVLILVAENDLPAQLNKDQNLVVAAKEMENELKNTGKDVQLIIYPPFEPHGHVLFFEIREYWGDVIQFINKNL